MTFVVLCECGCGEAAPIATVTNRRAGRVVGQPSRFVHGHNSRVRNPARREGPKYQIDPDTGCWVWQWAKVNGYGRMGINGKVVQAHRHYYEAVYGPLGDQHLHHRCKNRACVNPDHLQPMSAFDHISMTSKERHDIVAVVLESGLLLDEVARRLGVV